jgi:hypothetical protein
METGDFEMVVASWWWLIVPLWMEGFLPVHGTEKFPN